MGKAIDDTLGTNIFGRNSHDEALMAQKDAASQANATQRYMYDTQREDLKPWREAGTRALAGLEDPNFMKDFTGDPGYQFRYGEGEKAINSAAAARGMGNSGATMKALTRYGQEFASNEYNNAYNRAFGRLSTLAGFGNNATNAGNAAAQNYGNNVSANQIGMGNAIASSNIAQANRNADLVKQGAQLMFSDERLKTDVESVSKADLDEMRKHLKAYAFKYRSEDYGQGDWVGVMAQDLEKSKLGRTLVVEGEDGLKRVDLRKVLSLFLATMAEA